MAHLDHELLSAYIDAELSPDDMQQVERHLAECDTCQREYAELRGIATMVRELPTYLPRRVVEIDERTLPRQTGVLAHIVEFGKPLAVAALILLIALAGIRLLVNNDDDSGEEGQISFSAVQEEPTPDGTVSTDPAFEPPAAGDMPPNAAMMPAREAEQSADSLIEEEEAAEESEEVNQAAPDAAEQEPVEATMTPAAPAETEPDDEDDGTQYWLIAVFGVITIVVAFSAARYALRSSPRHPRN